MSASQSKASVILIHGLWMNAATLYVLHLRMQRCGYHPVRFGYPTVRDGLAKSAAQLSRLIESLDTEVIHIVAHSMGGLVTFRALNLHADQRVRRVVLLGSPIAGSMSGRRLASFNAGRILLGANSHVWGSHAHLGVPEGVEIGVIAGTLPLGLGHLVGRLTRPHDGTVSVAETHLPSAKDTIHLRVSHTAMLVSGSVGRQACFFLQHGRFLHDAPQ